MFPFADDHFLCVHRSLSGWRALFYAAGHETAGKYYAKAFDAFCESPEECRDRLESLRNEDAGLFPNGITGELVDSTFAKYLAVKQYTLPMLANTSEFNYFSFYRHILLYVVEHDTHPELPIPDTGYKYPPLPGMSECDIDFDY